MSKYDIGICVYVYSFRFQLSKIHMSYSSKPLSLTSVLLLQNAAGKH